LTNPLVLLVEDNVEARNSRTRLLRQAGCIVLPVDSPEEALRELWSSPMISTVITDINFGTENDDQSGVPMARYIRSKRKDVPIIGYSGVVGESAFSEEDKSLFDALFPRISKMKTWGERKQEIDTIADKAREYARVRRQSAFEKLEQLRSKHQIDLQELDAFRHLIPNEERFVEQILHEHEYEALVLVRKVVGRSLLVWTRAIEDGFEAEVFGVPELYAHGADQAEAIEFVGELMQLYFEDLRQDTRVDSAALELQSFLLHFFEVGR
jgi:CheY-like chemotaxis protein/predicted RNase H-like HicB family nuclease